jgi:hypothetical protein
MFWKMVYYIKMCFNFLYNPLSEILLIVRRMQQYIIKNVRMSICNVPVIIVRSLMELQFPRQIFEKSYNTKFHET